MWADPVLMDLPMILDLMAVALGILAAPASAPATLPPAVLPALREKDLAGRRGSGRADLADLSKHLRLAAKRSHPTSRIKLQKIFCRQVAWAWGSRHFHSCPAG